MKVWYIFLGLKRTGMNNMGWYTVDVILRTGCSSCQQLHLTWLPWYYSRFFFFKNGYWLVLIEQCWTRKHLESTDLHQGRSPPRQVIPPYGIVLHLILINHPDHCQNLINWSVHHFWHSLKISSKSFNNFLSDVGNTQTNKQMNSGKNITSSAEAVSCALL